LLVQIDTRALQLEIDHFTSELASKRAQFDIGSIYALDLQAAQTKLELGNLAKSRGQISQVDLDGLQRAVDAIERNRKLETIANEGSLEGLKSNLDKDELQKKKMSILAPFDGVVTAVYTSEGALIGNNERIATLITDARTVEAKISEEDFAGVARGQKASVTFLSGAGARDRAFIYNARVSKILPTADPETQRYLVDLEVEGVSPEDLIPGKTGEVTITIGQREAQAIVPRRALSGNRLYVVKDGKVEIRTVTPGFKWLEGEEILKGVEAGEQVIVEQQDQFHEGDSVKTEVDPTVLAYEKSSAASPKQAIEPPASK
jgi:RND family efflux transporter MFP subunit